MSTLIQPHSVGMPVYVGLDYRPSLTRYVHGRNSIRQIDEASLYAFERQKETLNRIWMQRTASSIMQDANVMQLDR
jgi:hypothetical protein